MQASVSRAPCRQRPAAVKNTRSSARSAGGGRGPGASACESKPARRHPRPFEGCRAPRRGPGSRKTASRRPKRALRRVFLRRERPWRPPECPRGAPEGLRDIETKEAAAVPPSLSPPEGNPHPKGVRKGGVFRGGKGRGNGGAVRGRPGAGRAATARQRGVAGRAQRAREAAEGRTDRARERCCRGGRGMARRWAQCASEASARATAAPPRGSAATTRAKRAWGVGAEGGKAVQCDARSAALWGAGARGE